jgi:hypothetical protein
MSRKNTSVAPPHAGQGVAFGDEKLSDILFNAVPRFADPAPMKIGKRRKDHS